MRRHDSSSKGVRVWPTLVALISLILLSGGTTDPKSSNDHLPPGFASFFENGRAFARQLFAQSAPPQANFVFSPYSVSVVMAVAQVGARGTTREQVVQALRFPTNQNELKNDFVRLRTTLDRISRTGNVELTSSTALWIQKDYGFNQDFIQATRRDFAVGTEFVDFISGHVGVERQIAAWIAQQTKGKISGDALPSQLSSATRLVIANAIYFKGAWSSRFDSKATRSQAFFVSPDKRVTVSMMRQEQDFGFSEDEEWQVVELPYTGRELSMIIFLPKQRFALHELETKLDAKHIGQWIHKLETCKVDMELPRFKIRVNVSLKSPLLQMGLTNAFDPVLADFGQMTVRRPLFISAIDQAALVEVNEEGTVAAAATRASFGCGKAVELPRRKFSADHPFLFLIRENQTGAILFLGRLVDPTK